jgi:hypothetical protein
MRSSQTTARLQERTNELEKMKRIAGREIPGAPHEVLLVIDATTGQNGLVQAREFTMMNLDLRKVLSLDQWRQLKSIRGQGGGPGGDRIFFRKVLPPGASPSVMIQPPGEVQVPAPPPPLSEDMY